MRIAVFGAGGAGGYFGARLARSGVDVTFIARGAHLEAIHAHGLRVKSLLGNFVVSPARATDDPSQVGIVDVVILGVKAWQVESALPALRSLVGPDTTILPLQNGVEAAGQLAAGLGVRHVVGGLARIISVKAAPGHIHHVGADPTIAVGELDKQPSARIERIREAFHQAGISVDLPADIEAALWQKFLLVSAWGGVGTVTDAPIGVIRSLPETRRMLEQVMDEVVAVARARKVAVSDGAVSSSMAFLDSLPPGGTTSLHRDIMDGKPSELEFWNGAVVRLGRAVGIDTPLNRFVLHSLLPRERRARGELVFPQ